MATSSAMAINPTLYKKIAYDPVKDFEPIAMMAHLPFILVVNNDLPVKTVAEFIKYAKANPGKLATARAASVRRIISMANCSRVSPASR